MLERVVNGRAWQSRPTYEWEYSFAAVYLALVTLLSTDFTSDRAMLGQALSAAAVFVTFQHMSVASRLEEAEAARTDTRTVECYQKLTRFLVLKEALWVAAFVALGAWTALAGVPLFLLYPVWRRAYRQARRG
jgi:hypothetical protein